MITVQNRNFHRGNYICSIIAAATLFVAGGAVADNAWTYDSSTNPKTISNGTWTIQLINDHTDIENGVIQLGNITAGSGVLDLRNMVDPAVHYARDR